MRSFCVGILYIHIKFRMKFNSMRHLGLSHTVKFHPKFNHIKGVLSQWGFVVACGCQINVSLQTAALSVECNCTKQTVQFSQKTGFDNLTHQCVTCVN